MTKQAILEEIRRTAQENKGVPLGRERFEKETGLRTTEWYGKHWARWNDAIREAGFGPNSFNQAYGDDYLCERLASLTRELGRFPVAGELRLKANEDKAFPGHTTFSNWGSRAERLSKLASFCHTTPGYEDVLKVLPSIPEREETIKSGAISSGQEGFVYLFKSGRFHKIGRSNSAGRREYELSIQLPEKLTSVHQIRTDDPVGIEAYWHKRFESKRKNGEWFELDASDVKAFKRRKFM